MLRRATVLFFLAFVCNVAWENAHAFLYTAYKSGAITESILLRASLFDACLIVLIFLPFQYVPFLKRKWWLALIIALAVATVNEWYGLSTSRWVYGALMPIVPYLYVGVSPFIQLAVTGYVAVAIQKRFFI